MTRALLIAVALLLIGADAAVRRPRGVRARLRACRCARTERRLRLDRARVDHAHEPRARRRSTASGSGCGATAPGGCRAPRAIRISDVRSARAGSPTVGCTAVALDLASPIAPGARGRLSFRLAIRVPRRRDRFGRGGVDLALLSNALPALAVREAGAWRLEPYFSLGEAWVYPTADWRVRLRRRAGSTSPRRACAWAAACATSPTAATTRSPRAAGCAGCGPRSTASASASGARATPAATGSTSRCAAPAATCAASRACTAPTAGRISRSCSRAPRRWSTPR